MNCGSSMIENSDLSSSMLVASRNEISAALSERKNASQNKIETDGHFHEIVSSWKRDHPSAFSPYKPTTVLTNLQRGNVQTQAPSLPFERSVHQLAALGELFFENVEKVLDHDLKDCDGLTPLMWAAAHGQLDTVRQLIACGATVSTLTPTGKNALLFACSAGHSSVVKELINHGAVIDYKDQDGNSALMYAAFNDHAACVQELLNAGSILTLLNKANETAYDVCIKRRSKNAQAVLEKYTLSLLTGTSENLTR